MDLLKEYILNSTKTLLVENKPLDKKTLIEIFNFRYSTTFSKVQDKYVKQKVEFFKKRIVTFINKNYTDIRIYSNIFLKRLFEYLTYILFNKEDEIIEELRELISNNLTNIIDIFKKHKDRVWDYLTYKEKERILLGKEDYNKLVAQYELCLSKKMLPPDIHKKVINNKNHGEVIFEDSNWVFVRPKTKIGSLAWATSYHTGEKEPLRPDLKDKVSWCTASFGDNWWSTYSKKYILVYCIAKDYDKESEFRKITIGFDISEVFNHLNFINYEKEVTQDAENVSLDEYELEDLVGDSSLYKLSKIVRLICVKENKVIDKRIKYSIDSEVKDMINSEITSPSKEMVKIFDKYLNDNSLDEADIFSIKNYITRFKHYFIESDLKYLEKKYNINFV